MTIQPKPSPLTGLFSDPQSRLQLGLSLLQSGARGGGGIGAAAGALPAVLGGYQQRQAEADQQAAIAELLGGDEFLTGLAKVSPSAAVSEALQRRRPQTRESKQDQFGVWRYVDTHEPVFPNVEAPPPTVEPMSEFQRQSLNVEQQREKRLAEEAAFTQAVAMGKYGPIARAPTEVAADVFGARITPASYSGDESFNPASLIEDRPGNSAQKPDSGPGTGFRYRSDDYKQVMDRETAKDHASMLDESRKAAEVARERQGKLEAMEAYLERAPVGPAADSRVVLGKVLGGTPAAMLPLVPDREETIALEQFARFANSEVLTEASKLKGALTENERRYVEKASAGITGTKEGNRQFIEISRKLNERIIAYSSLQAQWLEKGGDPQDFPAYFKAYAEEVYPLPGYATTAAPPPPEGFTIVE